MSAACLNKGVTMELQPFASVLQDLQQHLDPNIVSINSNYHSNLVPSTKNVLELITQIRRVIFADYYEAHPKTNDWQQAVMSSLLQIQPLLQEHIWQCLSCSNVKQQSQAQLQEQAFAVSWRMLNKLPQIRSLLNTDAQAAYAGDPACENTFLPVLCYPSMLTLTYHRLAHILYCEQIPILPRMINELAHSQTGIDIHPGAEIGSHFFIDHGTGVVIGETTIIGHHVKIYHGVTLGAKSFPTDTDGNIIKFNKRHPIIGNHVTIYSNAVILGRVNIGDNSVIGGNVWLTNDIPPNSTIYQK